MKIIKDYVEAIDEEIEGAQKYAEKYIEALAGGDIHHANQYNEMSHDELRHAGYIHAIAVEVINSINKVYRAPESMLDKWEKAHREYLERVSWIKNMLENS